MFSGNTISGHNGDDLSFSGSFTCLSSNVTDAIINKLMSLININQFINKQWPSSFYMGQTGMSLSKRIHKCTWKYMDINLTREMAISVSHKANNSIYHGTLPLILWWPYANKGVIQLKIQLNYSSLRSSFLFIWV